MYVVIINVVMCPFDHAKYFDEVLYAVGVDVAMKMARVAILEDMGESNIG